MEESALAKAIQMVGGQTTLARQIGVEQGHIRHWLNHARLVPADHVLAIEAATAGRVTRHELRPDLYPAPPAPQASDVVEEDRLRAQCYGLLAQLLARPPGTPLLGTIAHLSSDATALGRAFGDLARAAAEASPAELEDEYHRLFIGLGRGELLPYGSYYLTGFLFERPLARLREDMRRFAIARKDDVAEPEDHIASLCEMMAGLILGNFGAPATLTDQRSFFDQHIGGWAGRFFSDLERARNATLYRPIGTIGRLFMTIETEAFAMVA